MEMARSTTAEIPHKPFYTHLYVQVLTAIVIGVLLGHFYPDIGEAMKPLGDGFIKLIKMLIAPIIFCTVVHGIASMSARTVDAKCYSGSDELEQERSKAEGTLGFFVTYCNNRELAAKTYVAFGIDPVEELTNLAEKIRLDFPHSMSSHSI